MHTDRDLSIGRAQMLWLVYFEIKLDFPEPPSQQVENDLLFTIWEKAFEELLG